MAYASEADRQDYEVLGGRGLAWFNLGEDLTVDQVLKGQGSYESDASFEKWKTQYDQGQQGRVFSFLPDDVFDDVDWILFGIGMFITEGGLQRDVYP